MTDISFKVPDVSFKVPDVTFKLPSGVAAGDTVTIVGANVTITGPTALVNGPDAPIPPPVITAPGVVQNLTATLGTDKTSVILNWAAPANTGGAPVTGYAINGVVGSTATTSTITGLGPGTYSYGVAAINVVGTGPVSTVSATVPTPVQPPSTGPGVIIPVPPPHFAVTFGGYPAHANINSTVSGTVTDLIEWKNMSLHGPVTIGQGADAALRAQYFKGTLWIHDCDFVDLNWSAINVLSCTGTVIIEYCRYRNQTRNFVQFATQTIVSGHISNNKGVGGATEDIINFYQSGGKSTTDRYILEHNAFQGTNWTSGSGSGMAIGDGGTTAASHIVSRFNTFHTPGQVGVFISDGTDNHVTDNIIYSQKYVAANGNGSNVGIYTPYVGGAINPGGHSVERNRVFWINKTGSPNSFWNGGASGTVAGLSPNTNTWQDTTIDPAKLVVTL